MNKITRVSKNCLSIIEHFECGGNFRNFLTAYKCPAGKWTIGMGTTRYPDGGPVMPEDAISEQKAYECLTYDLSSAEAAVAKAVTAAINQQQFDALVDFTYNLGVGSLKGSTLLKVVNANPNDPDIGNQFDRWIYAAGSVSSGLIRRRRAEAWLYFYGELKFDF